MPEAARQSYQGVVQQAHEKFSETVRLTMLSLLGFALFCLLITFSTPDSSLLVADPTIKMPLADVQVSFQSFLILAPFLLIVVTLYLHIFYGYWLDLERDYQHLTRSCDASEPSIERHCQVNWEAIKDLPLYGYRGQCRGSNVPLGMIKCTFHRF
jgi:hypothetical protein